jgi:hypothetical protein
MARFEFSDDHYGEIADLMFCIRDARAAWHAADGRVAEWEWDSFVAEIWRGQRAAAPLHTLIAQVEQWSAGWWRRAHARTHRPGEPQNSRNSERPLLRSKALVSSRLYSE